MKLFFSMFWSILLMMLVLFIASNVNNTSFSISSGFIYGAISGVIIFFIGEAGYN